MAIGENIRQKLKAKGKSMVWLSEQTGIPASTIRSIVSRAGWSISDVKLGKIADALGTDPAELVYGEEQRRRATEHTCEFCYYEYFDGKAYPCSMCICGEKREDMFQPKNRRSDS